MRCQDLGLFHYFGLARLMNNTQARGAADELALKYAKASGLNYVYYWIDGEYRHVYNLTSEERKTMMERERARQRDARKAARRDRNKGQVILAIGFGLILFAVLVPEQSLWVLLGAVITAAGGFTLGQAYEKQREKDRRIQAESARERDAMIGPVQGWN
jgi:hypothetical protein